MLEWLEVRLDVGYDKTRCRIEPLKCDRDALKQECRLACITCSRPTSERIINVIIIVIIVVVVI